MRRADSFIIGRVRVGLLAILVGDMIFALADLALRPENGFWLGLVKAFHISVLGVSFFYLRGAPSRERAIEVGVANISLVYWVSTISGFLSHDPTTPPLLAIVVNLAAAIWIPWGWRVQLVSVLNCVLAVGAHALLQPQIRDTVLGYPGVGILIAAATSMLMAVEFARYQRLLSVEEDERQAAEEELRQQQQSERNASSPPRCCGSARR